MLIHWWILLLPLQSSLRSSCERWENSCVKILIGGVLSITCVSCQTAKPPTVPSVAPLPPLPPAQVDRPQALSPLYAQALESAQRATQLSQQARSIEDWQAVIQQWQQAIALMKQIPAHDANHTAAIRSLDLLEAGIDRSQAELKRLQDQTQTNAIAQAAQMRAAQSIEAATRRLKETADRTNAPTEAGSNEHTYRAVIKSYTRGIPVIEVLFNGKVRFEMMVDTGASSTMITEKMSQDLKVEPVKLVTAQTPSGETQFPVGYVQSIAVGNTSVQEVPVAIGPVALLGHDFFGDCNINIKRDQNIVEFSQCHAGFPR